MNRIFHHLECSENTCDRCDIINEYMTLLANAQSAEQVREHLNEMFDDVSELSVNSLINECNCKISS